MKWPEVEIGQLCVPTEQSDPHDKPGEYFEYIDISSVDKDFKIIRQTETILGSEAPSRARKIVREGDVLVSTVRPNLNAVAIVPRILDEQIASTGFCILRPNPKCVLGKYLFYCALTPEFVGFLISRMRGANYPAVTDAVVREASIPLPPLLEQRRIVEILDHADAIRKKRAEANTKTTHILSALFYKMFGDPAANQSKWEITTLGRAGAKVRYGLGQPPSLTSTGVPMIRATNIHKGQITEQDMIRVDPKDVPKDRDAFLAAEEVLVVRSGAYTGDVAQVTQKWVGSVAGYDLVIRPGQNFCGEYIETFLLLPHVQKNHFGRLKARAGQPHINATQLLETPILLPPRPLQLAFARMVNRVRGLSRNLETATSTLDKLFKSLLYRAFSGNLTANWREAHMKELLAEMKQQSRVLAESGVPS